MKYGSEVMVRIVLLVYLASIALIITVGTGLVGNGSTHGPRLGLEDGDVPFSVDAGLGQNPGTGVPASPVRAAAVVAARSQHDYLDGGRLSSPEPEPVIAAVVVSEKAPPPRNTVEGVIRSAAAEFGQDADRMLAVAHCESTLRPTALGQAGERGIFQWLPQTWTWYAHHLGYGEEDAWDIRAQSRLTAFAWSQGYIRWWTCAR